MRRTGWLKAVLFAGLLSGPTLLTQAAPATASQADKAFLGRAWAINEEEVQLGHLATQRASTPEVKAMGEKMVQNHTRLGQQLGELGAPLGVTGAPALSADQRQTIASLRALPESEFDPAFKRAVNNLHTRELELNRAAIGRIDDPQLRAYSEGRVEALQKSPGMAPPAR